MAEERQDTSDANEDESQMQPIPLQELQEFRGKDAKGFHALKGAVCVCEISASRVFRSIYVGASSQIYHLRK